MDSLKTPIEVMIAKCVLDTADDQRTQSVIHAINEAQIRNACKTADTISACVQILAQVVGDSDNPRDIRNGIIVLLDSYAATILNKAAAEDCGAKTGNAAP
jgi:hypothetical protein